MEKQTKLYQKWWFWVCVILIIVVCVICFLFNKKVKFNVDNFRIEKDIQKYTYIEDIAVYKGKGEINTKDKKNIYLVAVKVILKDGGSAETKEPYITSILVENGKGEISTYDSGDLDKVDKPTYEFEIIGYLKFNK